MSQPIPLPLEGERVRLEDADGDIAVIRRTDGQRVGTVVVKEEPDCLFIEKLEIEQKLRGFGLGGEAAALVADAVAARGETLRAWAPPENGLAVYFWIRIGLRPLPGEGPNGGLWFELRPAAKRRSV